MMNKIFNKHFYAIIVAMIVSSSFTACSKDTSGAQVALSYKMLSDKTWYLDYIQTTNGTNVKTRSYLGQSTYFINFLKDNTTLDSDGLKGDYNIEILNGKIIIKINGKTTGGNTVAYDYVVESMGAKVLVMSYNTNGVLNKFYYSTK